MKGIVDLPAGAGDSIHRDQAQRRDLGVCCATRAGESMDAGARETAPSTRSLEVRPDLRI